MALSEDRAQRHAQVAAGFTEKVRGATDWDRPSPVQEWTAGDVVDHLTSWLPAFLAAGGVELPAAAPGGDRLSTWSRQVEAVQAILDDPAQADAPFAHPMTGAGRSLGDTIANFYTPDVFMHTWDLARATGQDDRLDEDVCAEMVEGMAAIEGLLRDSGQFGRRRPVADDAPPQARLIAFIGRDPDWRPGA